MLIKIFFLWGLARCVRGFGFQGYSGMTKVPLSRARGTQRLEMQASAPTSTPTVLPAVQALDYTSLVVTANELSRQFVPSRVENVVYDPSSDQSILLHVKTVHGELAWLIFSWNTLVARVGLASAPPRVGEATNSFVDKLRSSLKGHFIQAVRVPTLYDRVVAVDFASALDAASDWSLVLEVHGSKSNLMLLASPTNTIQACAYQVGSSRTRPLQVTDTYYPPILPSAKFAPPSDMHVANAHARRAYQYRVFGDVSVASSSSSSSSPSLSSSSSLLLLGGGAAAAGGGAAKAENKAMGWSVRQALVARIQGASPALVDALLADVDLDVHADSPVSDVTDAQWDCILLSLAEWASFMMDLRPDAGVGVQGGSRSRIAISPRRVGSGAYSMLVFGDGVNEKEKEQKQEKDAHFTCGTGNMNAMLFLRDYYVSMATSRRFLSVFSRCQKKVRYHADKAARFITSLTQRLEEANSGAAGRARALGDLVTGHIYAWDGKARYLECTDFISGDTLRVDLPDSCRSPGDYAGQLYQRARKIDRSQSVLEELIVEAQALLTAVQEMESALDTMHQLERSEDLDALRDMEHDLRFLDQRHIVTTEVAVKARLQLLAVESFKASNGRGDSPPITTTTAMAGADGGATHLGLGPCGVEDDLDLPMPLTPSQLKRERKRSLGRGKKASSRLRVEKAKASMKAKSKAIQTHAKPNPNPKRKGYGRGRPSGADRFEGLLVLRASHSDNGEHAPMLVVGRSASQNERISFTLARDQHLWFHAQGVPGSHCLLCLESGQEASTESIQFAADVAAYFSKARQSSSVPVGYCSPKFIQRPSGTGRLPGAVVVTKQEGMVYGRPEMGIIVVQNTQQ